MENSSSIAGNLASSAREKVIEELVRGREFAAQLKLVLHHQLNGTFDHESVTSEHLVTKVLGSFKEALSILSYTESNKDSLTSPPFQNQCGLGSRTRNMQQTWTRIRACRPIEDDYSWRKYGQKEILNAKHLRCYYRCSHRFNLGCQATKQVQRTDDVSPMFLTKYIGHHTCKDILKLSSIDMDSATDEEGFIINFQSNTATKQGHPFFSTICSSKEEQRKPFASVDQQSTGDCSRFHMDMLMNSGYLNDVSYDDELFHLKNESN